MKESIQFDAILSLMNVDGPLNFMTIWVLGISWQMKDSIQFGAIFSLMHVDGPLNFMTIRVLAISWQMKDSIQFDAIIGPLIFLEILLIVVIFKLHCPWRWFYSRKQHERQKSWRFSQNPKSKKYKAKYILHFMHCVTYNTLGNNTIQYQTKFISAKHLRA